MDEAFGLRSDRRIDRRSDLKGDPLPFAWDRRSTPSTAWFWVVVLSFWVFPLFAFRQGRYFALIVGGMEKFLVA